jgi:hypothetical protein
MRQTWKCRDYSNISEQLKITVESNGDGVASSRRRVYSRISTAFPGFSPRLFTAPNPNLNSHQAPRFDPKFLQNRTFSCRNNPGNGVDSRTKCLRRESINRIPQMFDGSQIRRPYRTFEYRNQLLRGFQLLSCEIAHYTYLGDKL